ncbi:MAG: LamG-like jellyroll fold domain-containing protein [Verrucomicrobiota bacterium]|jgi:hypothetical protein
MSNKIQGLIRAFPCREILIFVMSLGLALCPLRLAAQSVMLAWDPSTSANAAGYMLYSSTDGTNFQSLLDAGSNTFCTVSGLVAGSTNYFQVVAYDINDDQSAPSSQIEYTVPNATQTLVVQVSPAGAGSVTGGGSFAAASVVTVTAAANSGYTFASWTENGTVLSTSPNYSFTLTTNINLVANFTANPVFYTVATQVNPANAGSATGAGNFVAGKVVTVTAAASSGYTFTNWTVTGIVRSASPNYSFTPTTNINLVANFTANPVTCIVATEINPASAGSATGGGSFVAGTAVTVMATPNSPTNAGNALTNGLVAYYPLAGDANDYSGNGNNGAAQGSPAYTAGVTGATNTAISLNGANQYISLGHPSIYNFGANDFTISVWFKTDSTSSPQQLMACDDISGRQFVFDINDSSEGTISAYLFSSDSSYLGYHSGNILAPNTWYMAVFVKSGNAPGALTLYLNNSPVPSFAAFANDFPLTMQATGSEVDIGRRTYSGYNDYFSGAMSGILVYDRGLSVSEIGALYADGVGGVSPLSSPATSQGIASYTFANWTVNGVEVSASSNYSFTLSTNVNLVANFTANPVTYTVAAQINPASAGSATGGGSFTAGTPVTVTATANSGYTFANWTVNGVEVSASSNYSFTLSTNINLVANFTANPVFYTVATQINPANAGSATGGGSFVAGTAVTVTATANDGYTFANWTVDGVEVSASPSYSFTLSTNISLVANFTANPVFYAVATQISPSNAGSVTGGGSFVAGTIVTVTAAANSGYTFANWTVNGIVQSASPSYSFTLSTNINLVANFTANPVFYTVATQINPANAGSATGGGSFVAGTVVTVTAAANSGYTFTNWTVNGMVQSASPSYSFTLSTNINLVANFTANPVFYTVATQINPANAGSATGGGSFVTGTVVTVTATANSGYTFTNWMVNGIVQSASPSYSFTLSTNINLVANFATTVAATNAPTNSVTYTVSSSAGQDGSISPSGSQTVTLGANLTFAATPAQGFQVNQWLVNGAVAQTSGGAYLLQKITANTTVSVTFSAIPTVTTNSVGPTTTRTNANTSFSLLISGNGTLAPGRTAKALQAGRKYTLTAVAAKGSVFAGWTSNGILVASSPMYTFMVESNVMLQVNFIPNPFIPVAGNYHGLFYVTNDAAEESSGSFVATVTGAGAYSAKLRLGAGSYSLSGAFSVTGAASKSIARSGSTPITVELQLGLTNGPLTGTISDGAWSADLVADAAVYSRKNPAPQAGKYTLLIPGSENASTQPGGNGYGAVIVSESGNVTFSGTLGDGTPVSSTSIISSEGQWPLYVSLYGGNGSILGWLTFTNDGAISGQTGWFKLPEAAAKLYPGGFTNSSDAMGSAYQYTNGLPLLGFSQGQLVLTNGDLSTGLVDPIGLGPEMEATSQSAANQPAATLDFKTSSGLFKGSVMNPATGKPIAVNGVVLQNQNLGAGCFLGVNESGSVILSSAQ